MKTTLLGIATIIAALASAAVVFLQGGLPDLTTTFTAVTAGFGLIIAKDAK